MLGNWSGDKRMLYTLLPQQEVNRSCLQLKNEDTEVDLISILGNILKQDNVFLPGNCN